MADQTNQRMELLKAALQSVIDSAGTTRLVTRSFTPLEQQDEQELLRGIWMLVAIDESEFAYFSQGQSDEGKLNVVAVGHLKVREDQPGAAVEAAELAMVAELKNLINSALPAAICGARLDKWRISGQLSAPWGWVTANISII